MDQNFDFVVSLWKNFNNASTLLTKAMCGTANEVGEFAEILANKYYDGEQLPASNKSADIKTKDGKFIQVKSRKIEKLKTTSLNVIRSWDFDLLVVIIFNKEGNILKAIEIDSKTAEALATRNEHQNGKVLTTNQELLENPKSKDITNQLQNILDNKVPIHTNKPSAIDEKILVSTKHNKSEYFYNRKTATPSIELFPEDITAFKNELLKTQKAKRTWYFKDGSTKTEIWNASNFSETSDINANIKTNSTFRKWKDLGIFKVRLEILGKKS